MITAAPGVFPRRPAGGDTIPQKHKGVRHHLAAAEHLDRAAGHHREAARLYGANDPTRAHREAEAADARTGLALQLGSEAEKFHTAQFRPVAPDRPPRSRLLPAATARPSLPGAVGPLPEAVRPGVAPDTAPPRRRRLAPRRPAAAATPTGSTEHGIDTGPRPEAGDGAPGAAARPAHEPVNPPPPHASVTLPADRSR